MEISSSANILVHFREIIAIWIECVGSYILSENNTLSYLFSEDYASSDISSVTLEPDEQRYAVYTELTELATKDIKHDSIKLLF